MKTVDRDQIGTLNIEDCGDVEISSTIPTTPKIMTSYFNGDWKFGVSEYPTAVPSGIMTNYKTTNGTQILFNFLLEDYAPQYFQSVSNSYYQCLEPGVYIINFNIPLKYNTNILTVTSFTPPKVRIASSDINANPPSFTGNTNWANFQVYPDYDDVDNLIWVTGQLCEYMNTQHWYKIEVGADSASGLQFDETALGTANNWIEVIKVNTDW